MAEKTLEKLIPDWEGGPEGFGPTIMARRLRKLSERLDRAKTALLDYFSLDEIGDDIAPRISELTAKVKESGDAMDVYRRSWEEARELRDQLQHTADERAGQIGDLERQVAQARNRAHAAEKRVDEVSRDYNGAMNGILVLKGLLKEVLEAETTIVSIPGSGAKEYTEMPPDLIARIRAALGPGQTFQEKLLDVARREYWTEEARLKEITRMLEEEEEP